MGTPCRESDGTGKYLTINALDFLDSRLIGGLTSWRQLAGQLGCTSIDLDKYEIEGFKEGKSSPKLLLRDWENRHGGCDIDKLKEHLAKIGRKDILRDLFDNFEKNGIELVESRTSNPPISHGGQDVTMPAKLVFLPDGRMYIEPMKFPPSQNVKEYDQQSDQAYPFDCSTGINDTIKSPVIHREPHIPDKRHSDPLLRKDVPSEGEQSWIGGSFESVQKPDTPRNMKESNSMQSLETNPVQCAPSVTPPPKQREEELYQSRRDYNSLVSKLPSDCNGQLPVHRSAAPHGKRYLVVSSSDAQDKHWSKKLCRILQKKGHRVWILHDHLWDDLYDVFNNVDFVLVIYTENYRKEFQRERTQNWRLFQEMQREFKSRRCNQRFIPVYDVAAIRELPDIFLTGHPKERDYILQLLSCNNNPCETTCPHSSAPSQGTRGGAVGGAVGKPNAVPIRGNNQHLSKSEPAIVRDFHCPPNQSKPANTVKKESKFFNLFNKKGK